ncbi:MAG: DsrE/DsrF/TusD sulfur relay family protein [Cuniculiplasma sp.]
MNEILFILNDPPYGSEKTYNALRLALAIAKKQESETIRIFLFGDSVITAKRSQKVAQGYYNLETMLKGLAARGVKISACGTCMEARGMNDEELVDGVGRGSMDQLSEWTLWAAKVLVF